MAVTKRTRFEVLRRDDYTCRYCRSNEGALTIDHVVPVALGGTDDPSNLVAACKDCNAGKASTGPQEVTITDVAADAMRWARAIKAAADHAASEVAAATLLEDAFVARWEERERGWSRPLPDVWRQTIAQLANAGLPLVLIVESVDITFNAQPREHWRYFCGVAWKKVSKIQETARALIDAADGGVS